MSPNYKTLVVLLLLSLNSVAAVVSKRSTLIEQNNEVKSEVEIVKNETINNATESEPVKIKQKIPGVFFYLKNDNKSNDQIAVPSNGEQTYEVYENYPDLQEKYYEISNNARSSNQQLLEERGNYVNYQPPPIVYKRRPAVNSYHHKSPYMRQPMHYYEHKPIIKYGRKPMNNYDRKPSFPFNFNHHFRDIDNNVEIMKVPNTHEVHLQNQHDIYQFVNLNPWLTKLKGFNEFSQIHQENHNPYYIQPENPKPVYEYQPEINQNNNLYQPIEYNTNPQLLKDDIQQELSNKPQAIHEVPPPILNYNKYNDDKVPIQLIYQQPLKYPVQYITHIPFMPDIQLNPITSNHLIPELSQTTNVEYKNVPQQAPQYIPQVVNIPQYDEEIIDSNSIYKEEQQEIPEAPPIIKEIQTIPMKVIVMNQNRPLKQQRIVQKPLQQNVHYQHFESMRTQPIKRQPTMGNNNRNRRQLPMDYIIYITERILS